MQRVFGKPVAIIRPHLTHVRSKFHHTPNPNHTRSTPSVIPKTTPSLPTQGMRLTSGHIQDYRLHYTHMTLEQSNFEFNRLENIRIHKINSQLDRTKKYIEDKIETLENELHALPPLVAVVNEAAKDIRYKHDTRENLLSFLYTLNQSIDINLLALNSTIQKIHTIQNQCASGIDNTRQLSSLVILFDRQLEFFEQVITIEEADLTHHKIIRFIPPLLHSSLFPKPEYR